MLGGGEWGVVGIVHSKTYVGVGTFPGPTCKWGGRFQGPNSGDGSQGSYVGERRWKYSKALCKSD